MQCVHLIVLDYQISNVEVLFYGKCGDRFYLCGEDPAKHMSPLHSIKSMLCMGMLLYEL